MLSRLARRNIVDFTTHTFIHTLNSSILWNCHVFFCPPLVICDESNSVNKHHIHMRFIWFHHLSALLLRPFAHTLQKQKVVSSIFRFIYFPFSIEFKVKSLFSRSKGKTFQIKMSLHETKYLASNTSYVNLIIVFGILEAMCNKFEGVKKLNIHAYMERIK